MKILYFGELVPWRSRTQTIFTSSAGRTRWASGPYLVHFFPYDVATRTIQTHEESAVGFVRAEEPCVPTANRIRIGPHYFGVVICRSWPGKATMKQKDRNIIHHELYQNYVKTFVRISSELLHSRYKLTEKLRIFVRYQFHVFLNNFLESEFA